MGFCLFLFFKIVLVLAEVTKTNNKTVVSKISDVLKGAV